MGSKTKGWLVIVVNYKGEVDVVLKETTENKKYWFKTFTAAFRYKMKMGKRYPQAKYFVVERSLSDIVLEGEN